MMLIYVQTAKADSPPETSFQSVCISCHQPGVKIEFPSDPCDVCHETHQTSPNIITLKSELNETWQGLREVQSSAPSSYRYDERYQAVLLELSAISRISDYAYSSETIQNALIRLEAVQAVLSQLENEIQSGFWTAAKPSQLSSTTGIVQHYVPEKLVKSSPLAMQFEIDEVVASAVIEDALKVHARFLIEITLQRAGPPSHDLTTSFVIGKRLLSLDMQSLFYFEGAGCDRSASVILFFQKGKNS